MARKIVLEGNIQGNKPEEKITRLEARSPKLVKEIDSASRYHPAHNWYCTTSKIPLAFHAAHGHGGSTRQRFYHLGSAALCFGAIDRQFSKALSASESLKKTPIATYMNWLLKGAFQTLSPTLYDVHRSGSLSFYTSGEQAAAKAQDAFELSANSPIFRSGRKIYRMEDRHL